MGVHLGSIDLDGTADGDGIYWTWRTIDGWWEGGTPSLPVTGRPGSDGSVLGSGWRRGRPITLAGVAYVPTTTTEAVAVTALLLARRKVTEAADIVRSSGTFTVDEEISRFVTVRRNLRPEFQPQASPFALDFTVPMVTADWRKFSAGAAVSAGPAGSVVAANAGNAPTPPVVRIDGPTSAEPFVTNTDTGQQVTTDLAALAGGDVVVIDFAALTMTLNGVDAVANLDVSSDFFDVSPGGDTVQLGNPGGGSITVTTRSAWL